MTAISAPDIGLMLLVLGVAAWTIAVRDAFAAVIGFVAYGLLLALLWVRLGAVDVALTEAAIGSGLTGMLLLRAGARAKATQQTAAPPGKLLRPVAAVLCATIAAGLASLVLYPPGPAPSLAPVAAASLPATGLGNPVTAVLLAFRAFDTFLEKVVLLLALIGVWSLAADRHWGGAPTLPWPADRDGALTFLAQDPSASGDCCRPLRILDRCGSPWGRLSRRRNSLGDVDPGDVGRRRERAPG